MFITKRPERLAQCVPTDWGEGYKNVTVCCTCENQRRVEERLPIFKAFPASKKILICEPLLEQLDISTFIHDGIDGVVAGGESGKGARLCNYDWILNLRKQCIENQVPFTFKQTGYRFLKDGKVYLIYRQYQHSQARKANINVGEKLINQ